MSECRRLAKKHLNVSFALNAIDRCSSRAIMIAPYRIASLELHASIWELFQLLGI